MDSTTAEKCFWDAGRFKRVLQSCKECVAQYCTKPGASVRVLFDESRENALGRPSHPLSWSLQAICQCVNLNKRTAARPLEQSWILLCTLPSDHFRVLTFEVVASRSILRRALTAAHIFIFFLSFVSPIRAKPLGKTFISQGYKNRARRS